MQSIDFDQSNLRLQADGCKDLFSYKNEHEIISVWELTDDDVRRILRGDRKVYLRLLGEIHPPVIVTMDDPFGS